MVRRQVEMNSNRQAEHPTPLASLQAGVTLLLMEQMGNSTKILAVAIFSNYLRLVGKTPSSNEREADFTQITPTTNK
jgi:hypothetical protein